MPGDEDIALTGIARSLNTGLNRFQVQQFSLQGVFILADDGKVIDNCTITINIQYYTITNDTTLNLSVEPNLELPRFYCIDILEAIYLNLQAVFANQKELYLTMTLF